MAEIKTKKQQLTFHLGMTNTPSDYVCSDNALEEEVGMIYNGAEHQPIQNPKQKFYTQYKVLKTHTLKNGEVWYILYDEGSHKLYASDDGDAIDELGNIIVTGVETIGNTLIVNATDGIHYFLRVDSSYSYLGNRLPEPNVDFRLLHSQSSSSLSTTSKGSVDGMLTTVVSKPAPKPAEQENYNNLVVGLYSKNKKTIAQKEGFCNPFMVRYALRLYDGSFANISNPIVLFPSVTRNSEMTIYDNTLQIRTYYAKLAYKVVDSISSAWSDIIKGIEVFVSDEVDVVDTTIDHTCGNDEDGYIATNFVGTTDEQGLRLNALGQVIGTDDDMSYGIHSPGSFGSDDSKAVGMTSQKPQEDIINELKDISVFYRLFDAGTESMDTYSVAPGLTSKDLVNLTTKMTLPNEDYFGHAPLSAKTMITYNNRLHLANVSRGFFDGFKRFCVWDEGNDSLSTATVFIKTPEGERRVKTTIDHSKTHMFYFYYPDPRAYKVQIDDAVFTLRAHSGLNGAYWINKELPSGNYSSDIQQDADSYDAITTHEHLANEIWVSEVNNPFVFNASGVITIGDSEIKGAATATVALSEGQFGQYPLIVFSDKGIWAVATNANGLYVSAVPLSREVCNNPKSITQTDGAVFFSSEKGLMVIVGSEVKCVSEQLNGKYTKDIEPLQNILKNSGLIAYDYRDSLLWILDDATGTIYIYNIKAGTFAQFEWQGELLNNVVNHYPDTLLQDEVGNVYSLLDKPNINKDESTYSATITTRPMKLEDAFAFKSLRQLKNVFDSENGSCTLKIEASNDMKTWSEITSLKGKGWKYFKFRYTFSGMKAVDRFAGTILVTQERFTEKLR